MSDRNPRLYSDNELIDLLKINSDALTIVYRRHRDYCINFMRSMYNDSKVIEDIFQDALIVLYENVNKPDFRLTCSIQTYLNSICRNQVLVRLAILKKYPEIVYDERSKYLENITDWFDDSKMVYNERVSILISILSEMKLKANRCYDLLVRFFYLNQSMERIALDLGYTNADNAKNQKYRCQKALKDELTRKLKKT